MLKSRWLTKTKHARAPSKTKIFGHYSTFESKCVCVSARVFVARLLLLLNNYKFIIRGIDKCTHTHANTAITIHKKINLRWLLHLYNVQQVTWIPSATAWDDGLLFCFCFFFAQYKVINSTCLLLEGGTQVTLAICEQQRQQHQQMTKSQFTNGLLLPTCAHSQRAQSSVCLKILSDDLTSVPVRCRCVCVCTRASLPVRNSLLIYLHVKRKKKLCLFIYLFSCLLRFSFIIMKSFWIFAVKCNF